MLTTVLQNGIWVTETSRSLNYWQPAPRWKLLPGLANPGKPAMSPHTEEKPAPVTLIIQRKERKERGPLKSAPILKECSLYLQVHNVHAQC